MITIFVPSIMVSSMLSLTAFLQAESQWWKGPLAALFLLGVGFLPIFVADGQDNFGSDQPILSLPATAWLCAAIIFIGSIPALLLRRQLKPKKIAVWVFFWRGGTYFLCPHDHCSDLRSQTI